MAITGSETVFRSLDGLRLHGTLVTPADAARVAAVLVHGGGATRDEGGFFTRVADRLAEVGVASLRFDLRGHGRSDGRQEDLTLSAVANDIRAATTFTREVLRLESVHLIGASFAGGMCAYFAVQQPERLQSLILINPLLNYKKRFIDDKPYWHEDQLGPEAAEELAAEGFLAHSPTFKLGRPLLNEVFYLQPHRMLGELVTPTLFIHGTKDTFIPVESSRAAVEQLAGEVHLLEIEGAQHGIAVHDDPQYAEPQTQEWQRFVIENMAEWITEHSG